MPMISLNLIEENPKNSNIMSDVDFAKLVNNIKRTGLYPPMIVRPIQNGRYMLIDGKHKRLALLKLNKTEGNAEVWNVSEKEADIMLASINTLRGSEDPRKRAELIDSLIGHGLSIDALEHMLPETKGQIEDLHKLMAVDADVVAAMERVLQPDPPESAMKMTFALFPGQYENVRKALDFLKAEHELDGAKNADAQALEYMAIEYLSGVSDDAIEAAKAAKESPIGSNGK